MKNVKLVHKYYLDILVAFKTLGQSEEGSEANYLLAHLLFVNADFGKRSATSKTKKNFSTRNKNNNVKQLIDITRCSLALFRKSHEREIYQLLHFSE
ncbi:hypothetical protein PUN28_011979 [Cardiocondyla obscurior]|uniref:Uncharacterized protein n=1 Tax=Cardiocondyla obscurior TaxID=286306 RepID=A0AAW2FBP2_9HYME